MGELIFMLIVAIVAIIMFIMSYSFPVSIVDQSGGAGLFPRIIIILLLIVMFIRTIRWLRQAETRSSFAFVEMFKGSRLAYLIGTVLYILVLSSVGYIISTIVYMIFMVNYFYRVQREEKPTHKTEGIILVSIVFGTICMYLFFGEILSIRLPQGILTLI